MILRDNVLSLIDQYWAIAYQQGVEGRSHDNAAGDAQRVLSEIYVALAVMTKELETRVIKLPTSADEAEAMEKIGFAWLHQHAPERLTPEGMARPIPPAAGQEPVAVKAQPREDEGGRTVIIGEQTISLLRRGMDVSVGRILLLPASDLAPPATPPNDESEIISALLAGEPFVFDPATHFMHADDGGAPEFGIRYVPATNACGVDPSIMPPPNWVPDNKYEILPQTIEEWDWRLDAPENTPWLRSKKRLHTAGCLEDPRAPDQMALVLRIDLTRIIGRLTWLNARYGYEPDTSDLEKALDGFWNVAYDRGNRLLEHNDKEGTVQKAEDELRRAIAALTHAAASQEVERAVEAERERCAKIAEGEARNFDFQATLARCDDMSHGWASARLEIARRIRGEG